MPWIPQLARVFVCHATVARQPVKIWVARVNTSCAGDSVFNAANAVLAPNGGSRPDCRLILGIILCIMCSSDRKAFMDQDNDWVAQSGWLRFVVRHYPEIAFFRSREELRQANKASNNYFLSQGLFWLKCVIIGAPCALIMIFGLPFLRSLGLSEGLSTIILLACCCLAGTCGIVAFVYRPYIQFLRQYLQEQGILVCLKCGYDLRGQPGPRCPECATPFDEKLLEDRKHQSRVEGAGNLSD